MCTNQYWEYNHPVVIVNRWSKGMYPSIKHLLLLVFTVVILEGNPGIKKTIQSINLYAWTVDRIRHCLLKRKQKILLFRAFLSHDHIYDFSANSKVNMKPRQVSCVFFFSIIWSWVYHPLPSNYFELGRNWTFFLTCLFLFSVFFGDPLQILTSENPICARVIVMWKANQLLGVQRINTLE